MRPKLWAPIAILVVGVLGVLVLVVTRPSAEKRSELAVAPLVRAVEAVPGAVQLTVLAHGTVVPRTETELVAQVAGEVVWVSPALVAGGFFAEDEELARIEVLDYEAALESARANVARAESETSRSRKERDRQRRLADQSVASQARIDDAESAFRQAEALLREARAQRRRAERDLERTTLRAPFDGRVRQKSIDVGQFVSRGNSVATLYAVDFAEVRLPIPDRELSFLDLSLGYHGRAESGPAERDRASPGGPDVRLRAEFAGKSHVWRGQIVRTEGELDPKTRMVHVVARVEDPYGRSGEYASGETRNGVPLAVGLFVEAEILGRQIENAYLVPRSALREGDVVMLIDDDGRLRTRAVEVLRLERDRAVVTGGLTPGLRVLVSPLQAAVEGMRVRTESDEPPAAESGQI